MADPSLPSLRGSISAVLNVFALVDAVSSRSDVDKLLEMPRQVALIGKARFHRHLTDGQTLGQESFGAVNTHVRLIAMGSDPHLFTKQAVEMVGTDMGEVGEVGERDVLGVVVVQVGTDPLHPLTLPSEWGERSVAYQHIAECTASARAATASPFRVWKRSVPERRGR